MGAPDEPQNIYDNEGFFAGYTQLTRFNAGFGNAMEHGPFLEMTGNVTGLEVLDLGCGGGQLAHRLAEMGAKRVTAVDLSERMLAVARSQWAHPDVTYVRDSIESVRYSDATYGLVVSSLAFHYVEDYITLLGRIVRWLRPGGRLVFSTEHPIYAARSTDLGWANDEAGRPQGWALDDYAMEGLRERYWFVPGVRRYHRTMATILNGVIDAGLVLERIEESHPTEAWLHEHPQNAEEIRRPMFLLVCAHKP